MLLTLSVPGRPAVDDLPKRVTEAVRRAARGVEERAARDGGYAATVEAGGRRLDGAALADDQAATAATARIGLVLLDAWRITGEAGYRDGALAAARALAAGQMASGGWRERLDTGPAPTVYTRDAYRHGAAPGGREQRSRLDCRLTGDGLRVLLGAVEATGDSALREAAEYGLRAVLNAQLAGGGWPAEVPLSAGTGGLTEPTADLLRVLLERDPDHRPDCRAAALRAGGFLVQSAGPGGWPAACDAALKPLGAPELAATAAAAEALLALRDATREERFVRALEPLLPDLEKTHPDLAAAASWRLRHPGLVPREPTREERARRTAARAAKVIDLLAALDADGCWTRDGVLSVPETAANMALLVTWLAEFEPWSDWPGRGDPRPPQQRRM